MADIRHRVLTELRDKLRRDGRLLVEESTLEIEHDDGHRSLCRGESLIDQLQAAIARDVDSEIGKVRRSKGTVPAVISLAAFDVMSDMDKVTRAWHPSRTVAGRISATVSQLCTQSVEEIPRMRYVSRYLDSWVTLIGELLEPPKRMHIVGACPECGETTVRQYNPQDREYVISPALQITRDSTGQACECLGCGAVWPESHFLLLAQVLGCEPACP